MKQPQTVNRQAIWAAGLDVALLLAFAAGGRRNHDESLTGAGVLVVAWPFIVAWAIAFVATGLWREPLNPLRAAPAWALALPLAILGRFISGRGNDPAFVVVAAIFTFACLVGWRAIHLKLRRSPGR